MGKLSGPSPDLQTALAADAAAAEVPAAVAALVQQAPVLLHRDAAPLPAFQQHSSVGQLNFHKAMSSV